jgi:hypothetical protein
LYAAIRNFGSAHAQSNVSIASWPLFALTERFRKALLDQGLNNLHETRIFKIRARFIKGKITALLGPGLMNSATFAHTVIGEQDTGAVFPGFEGVFIFEKSFPDLTVTDAKVPGNPVDVFTHYEQG